MDVRRTTAGPSLSDGYRIVALPSKRVVSTGAQVRYMLHRQSATTPKLDPMACQWMCFNDPQSKAWYQPKLLMGPIGTTEWDTHWSWPGHHKVVCLTRQNGKEISYDYPQNVASLGSFLEDGPALPVEADDPVAAANGVTRYVHLLHQISEQFPIGDAKKKKEHDATLDQYERYRARLVARVAPTEGLVRYPVRAEHFSSESQSRQALKLFLCKLPGGSWVLVDWTNPATQRTTGEYRGHGKDDLESIQAAFAAWDEQNRYPDGGIAYTIDGLPDLPRLQGKFETDGASFWDSISEFLGIVALGAAITAGVITLVAPVPGSQAVSALIWVSIFSSTASAGINMAQRYNEGFSSWGANAFDILTIAANLFGGAGASMAIWRRGAQLTVTTEKGLVAFVLLGQVTVDSVQGVLVAVDHIDALEKVMNDPALSPDDTARKVMELLRSMAVTSALLYLNVRGTKADLKNLKVKPLHLESELSPEQKLAQLADKDAKLKFTEPVKVEGHTDEGTHTTTVHVDQEQAPPSLPRARPNPRKPSIHRAGPQKTSDLDALYRDAEVAQRELSRTTTEIAAATGGTPVVPPSLKGRTRAEEKVDANYGGDASQLTDLARSSIVFETMAELNAALGVVRSRCKIVKLRDRFAKPLNGYRDVLMNVEMGNGHIVEMQLHLRGIIEVKESVGHRLYEESRTIEARGTQRPLTTAESQRLERLEAQMQKLYDDAYESAMRPRRSP